MRERETTQLLIILDDLSKWNPYYPTDQVVSAKDYLFSEKYRSLKHAHIINLCIDSGYLSLGHYCSMIAEARGHKALPSIKTMNDLQKKSLYIGDLYELDEKIDKIVSEIKGENKDKLSLLAIFGQTQDKKLNQITRSIFNLYPVPLLKIVIEFKQDTWKVTALKIVSFHSLAPELEDFFANTIDHFSNRIWRTPKSRKKYVCDLGILIKKDEKLPPSDEKALKKFEKACRKLNVFCEFIGEEDIGRINEFDALLVRTTTSINNFTYKFVKNAEIEGLVAIDDSDSILKCTNKIYVNNSLEHKGIPTIPGGYVIKDQAKELDELIKEFGFPLICKIPDGSFSIGVKKANDKKELDEILADMFKDSSLVLVQKYLKTNYDWRIGILDNQPLFACKYYMSQGHWQIYNHEKNLDQRNFSGKSETLPIYEVPHNVIQTALDATAIIGDGLYGVDLKEDQDGHIYVVEINDNPSIDSGIEDKVEKDLLYEKVIQSLVNRVDKNKKLAQE